MKISQGTFSSTQLHRSRAGEIMLNVADLITTTYDDYERSKDRKRSRAGEHRSRDSTGTSRHKS